MRFSKVGRYALERSTILYGLTESTAPPRRDREVEWTKTTKTSRLHISRRNGFFRRPVTVDSVGLGIYNFDCG